MVSMAMRFFSGGEAWAMRLRNPFISSLALPPLMVISLRWEASPLMSTVPPGSAKMGCWVKLGNTIINVVGFSQGISSANLPASTFSVSTPSMSPVGLYT